MTENVGRILLEKKNRGMVWLLRISNPTRRNALNWQMYDDLQQICEEAENDKNIRIMIIRGDGGEAFAAGTDIRGFMDFKTAQDGVDYENRVTSYFSKFALVKVPTIAVVEGFAAGGGLELVALCDLVLANTRAKFGIPVATTIGNCISPLVVKVLAERFGLNIAKSMLLFSEFFSSEQLLESGFIYQVADGVELELTLEKLTNKVCNSAPLSVFAFKEMFKRYAVNPSFDADDLIRLCYGSKDFSNGVTAFLQKETPHWKGN